MFTKGCSRYSNKKNKREKKKILFLLNTNSYSGAENVVIQIIENIRDTNFEMIYVSKEGPIRKYLENKRIRFLAIKNMNPIEINRIIYQEKPDIVHANDFRASIMVAINGWKLPIISHLHNNVPWMKKYHLYAFLYLLTSVCYRKILIVSPSILEEYVFGNWIRKKTIIVNNPINLKKFQEYKQAYDFHYKKVYDIGFLGRLTSQKNPFRFIEIIVGLKKIIPLLKIIMIGDGELRKECERKIEALYLKENITILGFQENPYQYLYQCKVLCMPSKWEGFGLAAVEALAFHIPVVATKVGGLPLIVDNSCGRLCTTNKEFIDEIYKLLTDENYYLDKQENARKKALQLDNIEEYMSNLKQLYNQIME